jgi:hypothetical protein
MAVPLLLSKDRVSGNGHAVVQVVAVVVALLVVAAVLALGTPPMQRAASEPRAATSPAPPPGVAYERATAELTRVNHLLEARQAELALSAGAAKRSLAVLRAQIASLEWQYAAAIAAVTRAR